MVKCVTIVHSAYVRYSIKGRAVDVPQRPSLHMRSDKLFPETRNVLYSNQARIRMVRSPFRFSYLNVVVELHPLGMPLRVFAVVAQGEHDQAWLPQRAEVPPVERGLLSDVERLVDGRDFLRVRVSFAVLSVQRHVRVRPRPVPVGGLNVDVPDVV